MRNKQKKKKGKSVQELTGIKAFTDYGVMTNGGELVYFLVTPTNISVLSASSIETKIRQLTLVLSAIPDIEIICTDSAECFENNKTYLRERFEAEQNPEIKKLLKRDAVFLDEIQTEMSTSRQFLFAVRCRNLNPSQVFARVNTVQKVLSEQGFDSHRMKKDEIKRLLALYFDASLFGEQVPDTDGSRYFDMSRCEEGICDTHSIRN